METIQLKTIDPISQELLKSAYQRGIKLNGDRYERLQPQDGFLRAGLSCPFGCMQGPCRIDPFGRGADRGLCGLNRNGMVAALFLRLTLQGALEAQRSGGPYAEDSLPPALQDEFSQAAGSLGGESLSAAEVFRSAEHLNRPMESPEALITQALRLGLLTVALSAGRKSSEDPGQGASVQVGYGLLAGKKLVIGVCGRPVPGFLENVQKEFTRISPKGWEFVSLGDWVRMNGRLLPSVCSSGEAELVLTSGRIGLLIHGAGTDPSILELGRNLGVPILTSPEAKEVEKILREVQPSRGVSPRAAFSFDPSLIEEAKVITHSRGLEEHWKQGPQGKLALIGGSDHLQTSLGWIPVEVASALRGQDYRVAGWGDAAWWMIKKGLASSNHPDPVGILDETPGLLFVLQALSHSGRRKDLKGVCFTGLKRCRDLATAVGLAGLGLRVCIAQPLPLWGSELVGNFLQETMAAQGGSLTHFDHPAQAQEILDWFLMEK